MSLTPTLEESRRFFERAADCRFSPDAWEEIKLLMAERFGDDEKSKIYYMVGLALKLKEAREA